MRSEFIKATTRYFAWKAAPWAAIIVKVDGGWHAFECMGDYHTWKNQK